MWVGHAWAGGRAPIPAEHVACMKWAGRPRDPIVVGPRNPHWGRRRWRQHQTAGEGLSVGGQPRDPRQGNQPAAQSWETQARGPPGGTLARPENWQVWGQAMVG